MAFVVNPEHVRINLSASAGATSTDASADPFAIYAEKRNSAIVSDCSKYKLAIERVDLVGQRNLPLFIPSIASKNPVDGTPNADPNLTNYWINMRITTEECTDGSFQTSAQPVQLAIVTFLPGTRTIFGITNLQLATLTSMTNADAIATMINTGLAAAADFTTVRSTIGKADKAAKSIVCSAVGGKLLFQMGQLSGQEEFANFPFLVSVWSSGTHTTTGSTQLGLGYQEIPVPVNTVWYEPQYAVYSFPGVNSAGASCQQVITPNSASYGAVTYINVWDSGPVYLEWVPQDSTIPVPLAPSANNGNQVDTPYYYCYDYEWFVGILNTALQTAFQTILNKHVLISQCPFVTYSPDSKRFTLYSDSYCTLSLNNPSGGDSWGQCAPMCTETLNYLQMGELLQNLLMFPSTAVDGYGDVALNFSQAPIVILPTQASAAGGLPGSWVALTSDWSPVASLWSPIGSLVFLTQYFPIRSEYVSAPTVFGDDDVGSSSAVGVNYDSQQVLSDVIPNITDAADWRSQTTLYAPTILRWVDMPSGAYPLETIDFQLGWRNRNTGKVNILTMNPLSSFSVKILLQRKDIID